MYGKTFRICCVPGSIASPSGPASFQTKLARGLRSQGIDVTFDLLDLPFDVVFVINGTRQIRRLWRCKRSGIRIVQRLGMVNTIPPYLKLGFRYRLIAEMRKYLIYFIRAHIADHIVYQSQFVKDGWEKHFGNTRVNSSVIYNGVDIDTFGPTGPSYMSASDVCIISVEGTQGGDGFETIINLGRGLARRGLKVEILAFGKIWPKNKARLEGFPFFRFKGIVVNAELPFFYRGAACFVPTDIIAACPNSVIEALSCGTPVLGYRAGVLPEMLNEASGICVEWNRSRNRGRSTESFERMVDAVIRIVEGGDHFRNGARRLAEVRYDLRSMVDSYMQVLFP